MPDWFTAVALGLIAASGGWLTYLTSKRSGDAQRMAAVEARVDKLEKRSVKLINYAQRLRNHIIDLDAVPEEWPDDIFD